MNHIIHAQRRASCAAIPRRTHHHRRPISTTPIPALAAPSAGKVSSEDPKTSQKKVKKEKRGPSESKLRAKEATANKLTQLMIKAYDAPYRSPPPAPPEEMERRYHVGRNFNIEMFKRHNEWNHDLAVKIRMKKHAVRMLPKEGELGDAMVVEDGKKSLYGRWKEEAMKINDNWGPPDHRPVPMYTPPIPGFDPSVYMEQQEEDT